FRVCCIERVGNLDGNCKKDFGFQGTSSDLVLQRDAIQKLHGDECLPVLVVNFVDSADVGVVESGSCPSLTSEAFQCLRVLRYIVRQKLECNEAMQAGVLGLVDHTHSAAADLLDDPVMRDGLTDELGRGGHWRKC